MKDLKKFKAESEKLGIPEASVYLLRSLGARIDDLESDIAKLNQHLAMTCKQYETQGGAAVEEILDSSVKPGMHVLIQMTKLGALPVTVKAAECQMGKIVVTFSADPGNDHELTYHVCK